MPQSDKCSHGKDWVTPCEQCELVSLKEFVGRWDRLVVEAKARIAELEPVPASAQQNDGGDETKWNCHCGNANCAGLHPNDASAQQDEREASEAENDAFTAALRRAEKADPSALCSIIWHAATDYANAQQVQADAGAVAWIAEHENDELDFVNFHEEVARQQAEESGALRVRPLVYGDAYTRPAAESDKRDALPSVETLRKGFKTSRVCGPDDIYEINIKYRSIEDLHTAENELNALIRAAMSREQSGGDRD
ncbi:hypothetical protein [Cupriavidus sp.]|uniref:hypothetical protein n=1 Tax=Cupriavidus sp. TaxID=1873897 RepID=UPI0031D93EC3